MTANIFRALVKARKGIHISTLISLGITSFIAVGLTYLNHIWFNYDSSEIDISAWDGYFTCYGCIYAIIAGFLFINTLERYQRLTKCIQTEINCINSIKNTLYLIETKNDVKLNEKILKFKEVLYKYIKSVIDIEWDIMICKENMINYDDISNELSNIYIKLGEIINYHINDSTYSMILNNLDSISKLRTERITLSFEEIPPNIIFLMMWMTLFLILGFILMSVTNIYINFFMTVGVCTCIHWLFATILDMDRPFDGSWIVSKQPFIDLAAKFETIIKTNESTKI